MAPVSAPDRPLVSVVIPTYNRAALLPGAIASVLAQRGLPDGAAPEVLVVDDGSQDETAACAGEFGAQITYLRQPNSGVARARNHGISRARGSFVCFLDSDDLWLPDKLARQLAQAAAHPEAALFATEIRPFGAAGEQAARSKASLYAIANGWVVEQLLFGNWIQTSTVMVRREALLAAGCFDEEVGQFGEDWLLWMRLASAHQVFFDPEPLVSYRVHAESLTSHQPESQFRSLMAILDKLATLPQFARKPFLIDRARYRICRLRGERDLRAGAYARALGKLAQARALRPWAPAALLLSAEAQLRLLISRHRADEGARA